MAQLSDLSHYFGSDVASSNVGGLQAIGGTVLGQQRVLRRLLTNPGDYIFHPTYGAGVQQWIGRAGGFAKLRAVIRGQMQMEGAVAPSPEPVVQVSAIAGSAGGGFAVMIAYNDAQTGRPATLSFNVSE